MPSLERTAYPRFGRVITAQELERAYTPSQEELTWARGTVRTPNHLLCLGILLKSFQRLHYFPDLDAAPEVVVNHIRQCFQLDPWLDGQPVPRKQPRGLPNQRVLSFMRDA
jgi:hypothetical protein